MPRSCLTILMIGLALLLPFAVSCDDDSGDGVDPDDPNLPRCRTLCFEDQCGADTDECLSECLAQTSGLEALCVQCLVEDSYTESRWLLDNGAFCARANFTNDDGSVPWYVCDADGDCEEDDDDVCDTDLPPGCQLVFGEIDACSGVCV